MSPLQRETGAFVVALPAAVVVAYDLARLRRVHTLARGGLAGIVQSLPGGTGLARPEAGFALLHSL